MLRSSVPRAPRLLAAFVVVMSSFVANSWGTLVTAATSTTVTGRVFQDFNSNGTFDSTVTLGAATDIGVQGIIVKAYDSAGAKVGETTSGANGTYSLSVTDAASSSLRVEFEIPSSGPLSALVGSFAGTNNGTSVQFVTGPSTNVDFAVNVPGEYCQNNPKIAVARLCHAGDTANLDADVKASPSLYLANYNGGPYKSGYVLTNGLTDWAQTAKGSESQTGSILGVAYDKRPAVKAFYASAYVRRHTRMYESGGKPVPGALFKMTSAGTTFLVDLESLLAGDQFSNSSPNQFGFIQTNADRKLINPTDIQAGNAVISYDSGINGVFEEVGAAGIGDIDMDDDGNLYVVSLYTKRLYKVTMPSSGSAPTQMTDLGDITAPITCTNGTARPFGLQPWRGRVYVGLTCDGAGDVNATDPDVNITANIVSIDPSAASPSFSTFISGIALGAVGDVNMKGSAANVSGKSARWWPWLDTYSDSVFTDSAVGRIIRPVPMFTDIEFDRDGSIIMGFRDRTGDQMSPMDGKDDPDGSSSTQAFSGGDVLRMCRTGSGYTTSDYTREGQTGCPTNGTNQNVGEYYPGDGFGTWHRDTGSGFTEQVPGFTTLLMTNFDPWDDGSTYNDSTFASGGVKYLLNSNGSPNKSVNSGAGVQFYTKLGATSAGSFRKVNGMADLEAACDLAPVQIGNRVWIDTDRDGIQDANETPVAGVTVRIYDATGTTLLGTAVTNAKGEYYFSSNVSEASTGTGDNTGGGIEAGKAYVIRFDNPTNYASGGPLNGYVLTTPTMTDPATSLDTLVDSNATTVNSYPQISTPVLGAGINDHSFDVGFMTPGPVPTTTTTTSTTSTTTTSTTTTSTTTTTTLPPKPRVSVGDFVWFDTNGDGVQDPGEKGLSGVTLSITDADGNPVLDVNGNPVTTTTTDANGFYSFSDLPLGKYKVMVTPPAGFIATVPGSGTSATDSSTGSATSVDLTVDGQRDPTLDFGFVPIKVSVGDYVWFDTNHDGVQDASEPPLAGVKLKIETADGKPVVDVYGNPVTTTTTDANGKYSFDNLPPGQYKVSVTAPSGMQPTLDGQGTTATDSSTGSATSVNLTTDGQRDPTLDFGFWTPPASVGSRVWADLNRDGIQDPGEPGISGVTLTLTDSDGNPVVDVDGNPVGPLVTDASGSYVFKNLPFGKSYKVSISYPSGYIATTANAGSDPTVDSSTNFATTSTMNLSNINDFSLDFGLVPLVSVGDFVWRDTNRDGVQDPGEPGIAGVVLSITKADGSPVTDAYGNPVSTTTTDANGKYSFDNLPPGQYKVMVTPPAGLIATAPEATDNDVDSSTGFATSVNLTEGGQRDPTLDFGFVVPRVSVGDYVWFDSNRDGIQDAGETPIAGVVLSITKADGSPVTDIYGNPVTTTTTDAFGRYSFDDLPLGQYKVMVTPPAGYVATVTGSGTAETDSSTGFATSVDLTTDGQRDPTLDFGFYKPSVSVGDYVWLDTDRDGIQDAGEPGIEGVTLTITNPDGSPVTDIFGNPVTTTTTDKDGKYSFDNLPLGQYKVTVTPPAGYAATVAGSGSSATDSSTGSATSVNLTTDGQRDPTLDFGFVVPRVSVGDYVWLDVDRDGVQDASESGIAGVTLTITKADGSPVTDINGNPVTTTTTDANGKYSFDNLPLGQYKVTVTPPAGYVATVAGSGSSATDSSTGSSTSVNLTTDGQRDPTLDFGFHKPSVSVGDYVWLDSNRDGKQGSTERGMANVQLRITKADGSPVTDVYGRPVTTTKTDANGRYSFDNLPMGKYIVSMVLPSGYEPTATNVGANDAVDSSFGSATSRDMSVDGDRDPTLDFGVVPGGILPPTL